VTPDGYQRLEDRGWTWLVRRDCAAALGAALPESFLAPRAERAAAPGHGRAATAALDVGGIPVIGKRLLHGGFLGPVLGGLYLGTERCSRSIRLARGLRERGVRTPDVVAAGWWAVLGPVNRIALLTEAIPRAENLQAILLRRPRAEDRRAALRAAARIVRAMHDAGFEHADLNLGNIVLEGAQDGPRGHVVDLDRGRFAAAPSARLRAGGLLRLLRSYDKWVGAAPATRRADLVLFLRAYAAGDRDLVRALRGGTPSRPGGRSRRAPPRPR
jgi:tRNA A-37 threonylcarbamoyl transferase component Bud32